MKKPVLVVIAVLLCVFFPGCVSTTQNRVVKTGYAGSSTSNRWSGRFKSYNGTESKLIRAKKGMDLVITFDLAAEEGALTFTAEGPDGGERFSTGDTDTQKGTLTIQFERFLRLRIIGEEAKNGNFQLAWEFSEGTK